MIVFLISLIRNWLEAHHLDGYVRVFDYVSFRATCAVIVSFLLVLLLGRRVIAWLIRQKVGDAPEFYNPDLNRLMAQKANTPTMGGILIVGSILISTFLLADLRVMYVEYGVGVLVLMAVLGGVDDWIKLTNAQQSRAARQGLFAWEKLLFQLGIAFLAGIAVYSWGRNGSMTHSLPSLPLIRSFKPGTNEAENLIQLPAWLFTLFAIIMIAGTSNAVNFTDGIDGLASGIASICAFALMVLCIIVGSESIASLLLMPYVPFSSELAVMAGAMAGACLGFLWFNCSPAQVFMGDTGSLALGALMAYIAVVTRQEFMLLLIGGIYFLELFSVVAQVGYFRCTHGKRIFRCAPIHYHFHLGGWTEQQVVVRFWLLTAVLTAIALATIRLR